MRINANNDIIVFDGIENINSGAIDIYNIEVVFSEEWNGLTKEIILLKNGALEGTRVELINDETTLPFLDQNALYYIGIVGYTVAGDTKTKQISTNLLQFWAKKGAGEISTTEDEVQKASAWEQYLALITDMYEDTITAKNTTEGYKEDAEEYKDTTYSYMNTTEGYKNTTEEYKDLAYGYKENAKISETNAGASETNAGLEADRALNNILNGLSTHNQSNESHPSILEDIRTVEAIARGKATGYVFDTYEDMLDWLEIPDNVEKLVVGDNLYIRDTGVKDYWWDGITYQELEAEAPDLTNYYTKSQVDYKMPILITRADYNTLVNAGTVIADRTYDIIEEV